MNRKETALLLAMVAAFDRRTGGTADVIAWQSVLDDIDFEDARVAVLAHFRESGDWLMPSEVRRRAGIARRNQAERDRPLAVDAGAVRQTTPPPEWYELRKRLAARPRRERSSFGNAMAAMAERLEHAATSDDPVVP